MSKPRNHKPKQAVNVKGSRHRTFHHALHGRLRRYWIVQIVPWFPGLRDVILQIDIRIIAVRLIKLPGDLVKVRQEMSAIIRSRTVVYLGVNQCGPGHRRAQFTGVLLITAKVLDVLPCDMCKFGYKRRGQEPSRLVIQQAEVTGCYVQQGEVVPRFRMRWIVDDEIKQDE